MEGTHHFCPARQGGQELLHQSCDLVLAQTSRDPLIENLALVPPILRSPGELEKAQLWPPFELGGGSSRLGSQSLFHGFHKEARVWTSETQEALT